MAADKTCLLFAVPAFGRRICGALAVLMGATAASNGESRECRPTLSITRTKTGPMQSPTLERRWSAVVSVDASRCAANASGTFEIGFSRLKENAPDIDFSEEFAWLSPSMTISVDLAADEAIEAYWIAKVSACRCAR